MSRPFENRVVLVTGGNSGIGKACSERFAEAGATVIIAARREDEGQKIVEEICQRDGKAVFIKTDLQLESDIVNLFNTIKQKYHRLDFAINNAGATGRYPLAFEDYTLQDWQQVMNLNLTSVFRSMQEEIKLMKTQGHGVIINVSSIAGLYSGQVSPLYTASKHGVIGLTRYAARHCGQFNIRVNALCPGVTETPLTDNPEVFKSQALLARIPMGRVGKPEEIADAAIWLCSDSAAFATGATITIDGGFLA
jgi:NAD(P)-dependent dehydrogenase (short-subunit alcohol dehydrogenase family)